MEDVEDYFLIVLHVGAVVFHTLEVREATAITIGVVIASIYLAESTMEVSKYVKKYRVRRKRRGAA